jgi:probable F420-dependent oxidoreductase
MKVRFAIAPHAGSLSGTDVIEFADAVEDSGFDGVWLSDLPVAPVLDPLLGLAMIAGRTSRLRLGANVVPLGRNPFILAKALAQLDQISDGRLLLSFVPGLNQPGEREMLGLGSATRGEVMEEALQLVRAWWRGDSVTHDSPRWTFTGLPSAARPVQDPLEVWLGGRGPKALDRVGRLADGWLGALVLPEETDAARDRINGAAAGADRDFDPEHFGMSVAYARTTPEPRALADLAKRRPDLNPLALLPADRDGLRTMIERYIEAGLSKFVVRPAAGVASWHEEMAWLADALLDLQT